MKMKMKKQISDISLELTNDQKAYLSSENTTLEGLGISKSTYKQWEQEPLFKWSERFLSLEEITFDDIDEDYVKAAILVHSGYSYAEVEAALSLDEGTILSWMQKNIGEDRAFLYLLESAEEEEEIAAKEVVTADLIKERCSNFDFRKHVAGEIGRGKKIGDLMDNILDLFHKNYRFTEEFTRNQAKEVIRESFRTCNPNDRKFNAKKYGEEYRKGRMHCIQGMGDGLLSAFNTHISNLNVVLEHTRINFKECLTPKEYASLTKDLFTAVSLYQNIAKTHQPELESPYDVLPIMHDETMLAQIEDNAKAVAQNALPTDTTKALPHNSDKPTDESSESTEETES